MCGIAGYVGKGDRSVLERMIAALAHRGPDDTGIWQRPSVGLAHARLSIVDTSPAGHQPMMNGAGTVGVSFNGEIYNFKDVREELRARGVGFRSETDTEVILALYEREGIACFKKLHGMFAVALYDLRAKTLYLVRDRMGEKPLYYTVQDGTLVFASELKGLLVSGAIRKEVDLESLNRYLQFDYVPTPRSILRGVHKLEPATVLTYARGAVAKERFWAPPARVEPRLEVAALAALDGVLRKAVARERVADVPVGVFLSGGIDSSTVAYYAQQGSPRCIETFSIGFDDPSFDESEHARAVARHLGTAHHEERVRAADALAVIPELGDVLCEPVADASIVPTLLLSRFARRSVKVALGGDGGDELFAGYPTFRAEAWYSRYASLPAAARVLLARMIVALPASHANFSFSYNLKKLISSDAFDPVRRHGEWLGTFNAPARAALAGPALEEAAGDVSVFAGLDALLADFAGDDPENRLLFAYARSYLMDEVLVKVDRASMSASLETRAPFLEHAVVDFAFALPYDLKYRRGTGKYLLKRLMEDKLPPGIVHRKKKGFGIPLARWLTGPLRSLLEEALSPASLSAHGLFRPAEVRRLIDEHMARKRDNRKELWNLLVFQLWHRRWMR